MGHFNLKFHYSPKKPMENWKKIPGYENYSVSDLGRVRNDKTSKILSTKGISGGYSVVTLYPKKTFLVHRLVAIAFLDNPENKRTVNHLNGNKSDNTLSNLEWATHQENIQHGFNSGLWTEEGKEKMKRTGEIPWNKGKRKLNEKQQEELYLTYRLGNVTQRELSKKYGVAVVSINQIIKEKS